MHAVSLMLEDGTTTDVVENVDEQLLDELAPVELAWVRGYWRDYAGKSTPPQRVAIALPVLPDAEDAEIELVVDDSLFRQVASIYALWGWGALLDTLDLIEKRNPAQPGLAGLVRGACMLLRERIATELASIEAELGVRGTRRWEDTSRRLQEWLTGFNRAGPDYNFFSSSDTWDKVNAILGRYHALNRERKRSEDKRNSIPGMGRNYVPGSNDDVYPDIARTFGKREKELMTQAVAELAALYKVCPAAVMVADATARYFDRSDRLGFVPDDWVRSREKAVGKKIVQTLAKAIAELDRLCASTLLDGVAESMARPNGLAPGLGEAWNTAGQPGTAGLIGAERIVARRCLESWDAGHAMKRVVTLQTIWSEALLAFAFETKRSAVMSFPPLVREYAMGEDKGSRSKFHACVCAHYLHTLEAEIEQLRRQDKEFEKLFAVINWISSIIAVVAFVAMTFASGGAAAPAGIAAVFAVIEVADTVATVLVLSLTVMDVLAQSDEEREQWRQVVAGLAIETPDTLRAVGTTLDSMGVMGWKITAQLVVMLVNQKTAHLADAGLALRLGIPDKIVLFRRSLELSYLADDIGAVATEGAIVFAPVKAAP